MHIASSKIQWSLFTQASFSSPSNLHKHSHGHSRALSCLDKQSASREFPYSQLVRLGIDLASFLWYIHGAQNSFNWCHLVCLTLNIYQLGYINFKNLQSYDGTADVDEHYKTIIFWNVFLISNTVCILFSYIVRIQIIY